MQFGRFYRYQLPETNKDVFLAVAPDQSHAVLSFVQTLATAGDSNDVLRVKGLDANARYRLTAVPQKVSLARFGGLLKHIMPFALRADGFILRLSLIHI